jgi:hypothetical protein
MLEVIGLRDLSTQSDNSARVGVGIGLEFAKGKRPIDLLPHLPGNDRTSPYSDGQGD